MTDLSNYELKAIQQGNQADGISKIDILGLVEFNLLSLEAIYIAKSF